MAAWARNALALLSLSAFGFFGIAAEAAERAAADPAPTLQGEKPYYEHAPEPEAPRYYSSRGEAQANAAAGSEAAEEISSPDSPDQSWADQATESMAPVLSSGELYDNTCWTAQIDFVLMSRANPKPKVFAIDTTLPSTDNLGSNGTLTTDTGGFRVEPGTRVTIAREMWRDHDNRDHSIEFSYLGPFTWEKNIALSSAAAARLYSPQDPGFVFQPGQVPVLRNAVYGAFAASDTQSVDYGSNLNSFEINTRTRWRLDRDVMMAMPDGGWTRQMDPGVTPSIFAGLRYVRMDENLDWTARRLAPVANGAINVETNNNLVGFQLGADWIRQEKCWSMGAWIKAGGYMNFAHQHTRVLIVDAAPLPPPTPPGLLDANVDQSADEHAFTFLGEAGINTTYHVTENLSMRGDLQMLWAQSIAVATNQDPFGFNNPPTVDLSGNSFFLGASFGVEYVW